MTTTRTSKRSGIRWLAGGLTVGLIAAALAGPVGVAAQAQVEVEADAIRSISVNGVGRVKAQPDVADISLGVTKQAEDAKTASNEAATTMDAVIAALLEAGIAKEDIQTTTLSLNPVYDWNENPPDIEGWEASNLVTVTVRDVSAVGDVVDTATAAGATNVNGIAFRVEDPSSAEAEARSAAMADAKAKADQLAAAAGVEVVGIVSISETTAQPPMPIYYSRDMAMAEGAAADVASTPVLPGEVELSITVFVQYEIG